ncbi:hypothetical protein QQZ08_003628 [Neonectria magnoliae]|uniref:Zonadhesin n=1 Tax=Neonectria magnoliae TaxID=2732573 RepID=A0ABR1IA92_9HYPO
MQQSQHAEVPTWPQQTVQAGGYDAVQQKPEPWQDAYTVDPDAKKQKRPDYRPMPLRWWFITALILVLLGLMGISIYTVFTLRDSDTTASLERRSFVALRDGFHLVGRQAETLPTATEELAPTAGPDATGVSALESTDASEWEPTGEAALSDAKASGTLTTGMVESKFTTTITELGSSIAITTSKEVTKTTMIETTETVVEEGYTTVSELPPPPATETGDAQPTEPLYTTVIQPPRTSTRVTVVPSKVVETVPFTTTKTGPPVTYVSTGTTTLYSVYTVGSDGKPVQPPITKVKTSEIPGTVETLVETQAPTTVLSTLADGQIVTVVSTPSPITRVSTTPPTRTIITDVSSPTSGDTRVVYEATTYTLTSAGYFIGKFLPPILAVLLALPIRALDQSAKQYQPFAALSRPRGAKGREALMLNFDGWKGLYLPFEMLAHGQPVPFLTTLAVWASSVFAPLASEAIGLKIHGRCRKGAIEGCALELGVSESAAYALVGLMGGISIILAVTLTVLGRRWHTGVFANPWCSAAAGAFARNPEVRPRASSDFRAVKASISEKRFAMGWFYNHQGRQEYGVVVCDEGVQGGRPDEGSSMLPDPSHAHGMVDGSQKNGTTCRRAPDTFIALAFWWRLVFLVFVLCILGVVVYYHFFDDTLPDKMQELFESEQFGVRFVCSALGVVVILCWECLFTSIAVITPFRRMASSPQAPTRSVLMTRPTNAISGLYVGLRCRDMLLFVTALAAVLAEFLPILLANVPYNLTQTRDAHDMCARVSAGLLALMAIALFGSLFVRWPDLPVDPRTLAGAMWYASESPWVSALEGVAGMDAKMRKRTMRQLGGRWTYERVYNGQGDRMSIELREG